MGHPRTVAPAVALVAVLGIAVAACGDSDDGTASGSDGSPAATRPDAAGTTGGEVSTVAVTSTDLGEILVDGDGRTLYLFTDDTGTTSTCYDACEAAWPVLDGPADAGDGVDADDLGVTTREDGTTQVTFAGHPLYHYAADRRPGDVTGQGVGGNWFVVAPSGEAVTTEAGPGSGGSGGASSGATSAPTSRAASGY